MYSFPAEIRRAYESLPIALVFDQYIDGRVVPLLISDGFCELVGLDRPKAMAWFTKGQFGRIHPDDVGNVARVSQGFIDHSCAYDVVFRCQHADGYHLIHAVGKWLVMPDGTELAMLTYTDVTDSMDEVFKAADSYRIFQEDRFYTDPLTGLPNMNYFREFADERAHTLRVNGQTPVLLYTDINSMRYYNNQYGFAQGDALLILIARALQAAFPGALVMRGTEVHFIIIDAFDSREAVAGRIAAVNAQTRREALGNTTGIQVGICVYEENMTTGAALDHARNALKQIGTDLNETDHFYSQTDDERYWNQRYILDSFDRALSEGWIRIYYQGIMRVETGKTTVHEALARWVDPNRGIISPGEFIPVLQKYHLLHKLDLYMMEQVCREIPMRLEAGLPLLPVSINFSGQDFDYVNVPAELNRLYDQYGIGQYVGKDYFIVEITEQDMATGTERFHEQLMQLRRCGYKLWLDDFGSGYSSLSMFSRFDFNLIKFDMELLRNLNDHNGANRRIIRAMVGVARELGIHTLVEGMETEEQRQFLREVGCELAQGFLFHRPEPLDAILYRRSRGQKTAPCETPQERKKQIQQWLDM
ncbi:MAG: EAL domain-containing protein [Clostridia bacterium]|nr:EAL domain-containing protein [Clostridia bacterium]